MSVKAEWAVLSVKAKWAVMLGNCVSPSFAADAIEAISDMLPLLDFPEAAFTEESLKAVARHKRRQAIPSFDEIETALSAWWKENKPRQLLLGIDDAPALPEPDAFWFQDFFEQKAAKFVKVGPVQCARGEAKGTLPQLRREKYLNLMRRYAPLAFERITAMESRNAPHKEA